MKKRLLSLALALLMVCSQLPAGALAAELENSAVEIDTPVKVPVGVAVPTDEGLVDEKERQREEESATNDNEVGVSVSVSEIIPITEEYVNPIYANVVQSSELFSSSENGISATTEQTDYCTTVEEAGAKMRQQMLARNEAITVCYETTDSNYTEAAQNIFYEAMLHTGVPVEGDYLKFQYASCHCDLTGYQSNDIYYLTLSYTITYYTTVEQEKMMDNAVSELLDQLDLEGKQTYEIIKGVYDYICETVTYDYDNLDDSNYTLKYTAYAALINKTAVCQGYASLFYRIMLELNIDCRVVTGVVSNGENHAWNIVLVDGKYYYIDSTWGATDYSNRQNFFLAGIESFSDHELDEESIVLLEAYDLSTDDYDGENVSIPITSEYFPDRYFRSYIMYK